MTITCLAQTVFGELVSGSDSDTACSENTTQSLEEIINFKGGQNLGNY